MMKKFLAICFLTIALGGCSTVQGLLNGEVNPIGTQSLAAVEASYGTALSVANGYKQACANGAITGSCRTVVVTMQNADRYAYAQILVARNFVKNNPNIDATVVISTAQAAVAAFQQVQSQNGVK